VVRYNIFQTMIKQTMNTSAPVSGLDDMHIEGTALIFNPYNPLNVEISMENVYEILTTYGLPPVVNNLNLYKRAFVHKSYLKRPDLENARQNIILAEPPENCLPLKTKSNERLEYLGDGVLELTTKFITYKRFPKGNEGFMTNKKIALVKNETIGKIAIEMRLNKWLILSKHAEEKNIRNNVSRMGCLFEAFVGAIFLDMEKNGQGNGFVMASTFIENVFNEHINWTELISTDDNYKNILQVQIQKEFKVTPYYLEIGCNAETGYTMGVYLCIGYPHIVPGSQLHLSAKHYSEFTKISEIKQYIDIHSKLLLFLGEGQHKIKKKAEQESCYNAIKNLEKIRT
jgi:dsRNA-specific ribonuclease